MHGNHWTAATKRTVAENFKVIKKDGSADGNGIPTTMPKDTNTNKSVCCDSFLAGDWILPVRV
jgi:hypothetical protein